MHRGLLVQRASRPPPPCGSFPPPCAPLGPLVRRTTLVVQGEPSLGAQSLARLLCKAAPGPFHAASVSAKMELSARATLVQGGHGAKCHEGTALAHMGPSCNTCARRPWCKALWGRCARTQGCCATLVQGSPGAKHHEDAVVAHRAIVQHLCKAALVQSATRGLCSHTGPLCNACARQPWCKAPRGCCGCTRGRRAMLVQGSPGAKCHKGAVLTHGAVVQRSCKAALVQSTTRALRSCTGPSCNTCARQPWCKSPQGGCTRAQGCCATLVQGGPGAKHHEDAVVAHRAVVQRSCKAALVQSATRGLHSHTGPLCNARARRPWCKAPRGCCAHT